VAGPLRLPPAKTDNPQFERGRKDSDTMSGPLMELADADFGARVLKSELPVLVDFWAPWCGPCKLLAPVLEELAIELAGRLVIGKLDIMQQQQTAATYGIRSIPALLLFKQGQVADTIVGNLPKQKLRDRLLKAL
jgi:thioredoxin 1